MSKARRSASSIWTFSSGKHLGTLQVEVSYTVLLVVVVLLGTANCGKGKLLLVYDVWFVGSK